MGWYGLFLRLSTKNILDSWSRDLPKYNPTLELGNHFGWCVSILYYIFNTWIGHPNRWNYYKLSLALFQRFRLYSFSSVILYSRSNLGVGFHSETICYTQKSTILSLRRLVILHVHSIRLYFLFQP